MLRNYFRAKGVLIVRYILLAVLCACGIVLGASGEPQKGVAASSPQTKTGQNRKGVNFDTTSLEKTIRDVAIEASEKHDPHASEHAKKEGELVEYTRQLAVSTEGLKEFTLWLFAATAFMCFIVTGQLWMFKRQLGQMKEDSDQSKVAAKLARDEFTASHRPWIAAEVDITNDLKWDANGLSFTVNVSLRNFGNAPARNVTSNHEVVAPVGTRIDAKAAQAALNDSLKIATEQAGVLGDVVFPSEREPKKLGLLVSIKRDQIKIYQTENSIGPRTSIPIVVVACIGYRSALTGDFHSTGVVFSVMRRGESAAVVPVEIDVDVTADHIGIVRNFCGSGIVT